MRRVRGTARSAAAMPSGPFGVQAGHACRRVVHMSCYDGKLEKHLVSGAGEGVFKLELQSLKLSASLTRHVWRASAVKVECGVRHVRSESLGT